MHLHEELESWCPQPTPLHAPFPPEVKRRQAALSAILFKLALFFNSKMQTKGSMNNHDAVVVGSGPNGLAAAIRLAQADLSVIVLEAQNQPGGGTQTMELTLPGFLHDVCSAVHPLAASSPFFRSLPLQSYGLQWIEPPLALAHPFDDGTAAVISKSIQETCEPLGADAGAYRRLMSPLVADWNGLLQDVLAPLHVPRHPLASARFGWNAWRDVTSLAERLFSGPHAKALFAGLAAHSMLPLERGPSAAFALLLGAAGHAVSWPIARGGSQAVAGALAGYLRSLGGEIRTNHRVDSVDDLPATKIVMCDVSPKQLLSIAGHRIRASYRYRLQRFEYGPGVYKVDWALEAPIPWTAPGSVRQQAPCTWKVLLKKLQDRKEPSGGGRLTPAPSLSCHNRHRLIQRERRIQDTSDGHIAMSRTDRPWKWSKPLRTRSNALRLGFGD